MSASAMAPPRIRAATAARSRAWLPSYSDLLLGALILWLFVQDPGWSRLMMDGDTGWHIRTGEWILSHGSVPQHDLFSFSKPGAPWFAWEWLSDVLFATLHRSWGLAGVAAVCGVALAGAIVLLMRQMAASGANAFVAIVLAVLAVGASSVHYHARPHVFTLLFLALAGNIVSSDLRNPTRWLWFLAPLMLVWTGLHGGFLALIAYLGLTAAGLAVESFRGSRPWNAPLRYAALTAVCAAVTLLNPYGIGLHTHIAAYLQSSFIADLIQEFQSPIFRSEATLQFELLLFAGVGCCVLSVLRGRIAPVLPVLYFAHASLGAVRHVPLYVLVAVPVIAAELTELWRRYSEASGSRSLVRELNDIAADSTSSFRRLTPWAAVLALAAVAATPSQSWPTDFSPKHFPAEMVSKYGSHLAGSRLLTSDQWGDYLIYRLYPEVRVYMDGRSDFYGEQIGREYLAMLQLDGKWHEYLQKNQFDTVLAPVSWPLVSALRMSPEWRETAGDAKAVLFVRRKAAP